MVPKPIFHRMRLSVSETKIDCTVFGTNITCSGSGNLTQDHVYNAGTFTTYEYAVIESGITSIEENSFRHCYALKEVTIPETVISVGSNAFLRTNITSVILPASLQTIEPFNNCEFHTSISIAGGTTFKTEDGMLLDHSGSTLVIVPVAHASGAHLTLPIVENVNESALRYNKASHVTIPEGIKRIRSNAFYHAFVEQIDVASSVTIFSPSALSGCLNLTTINLSSSSVQLYYEGGVFGRNKKKSGVYVKQTIIWIKNGTESIEIGEYLEEIGKTALQDCESLVHVTCNALNSLFLVDSSSQIVMEYAEYSGAQVKKTIGCVGGATVLSFDDDIVWIGKESFRGLSRLREVTLNKNLVRMDAEGFRDCPNLESVDFQNCKCLDSDGNSALPRYMFYWAYSLKTISNWPLDPFAIGDYCFTECLLDRVTLPSHVTHLGSQCFANCRHLTDVTIPKSVTVVGSQSFYECLNLSNVAFEEVSSVTTLESMSFACCPKISSITLPDSITSLLASCFSQDERLYRIIFAGNNGKYRSDGVGVYQPSSDNKWHRFVVCPAGVYSISLAASTNVIGRQAFYGCSNLIEVSMNDCVVTIEESSFFRCPIIEYLRLPGSIRFIGPSAFRDCPRLTNIFYCNDRDNVEYTEDPFPTDPDIYVFQEFTGSTFCGHPVLATLDPECHIATDKFSDHMLPLSWKKNRLSFLISTSVPLIFSFV